MEFDEVLARQRQLSSLLERFEQARIAVQQELDGVSFPGRSERGHAEARVDVGGRLLGLAIDQHALRRGHADQVGAEMVAAVHDARERMVAASYARIARTLAGSGGAPS